MKCKVVKGFIDKYTEKPYEVDDVYECTEDRYKEVQASGNYLMAEPKKVAKKANIKPEK